MAENLWVIREQKRISVAGLANRAGLPIGLIMEYESGQRSIDPRHLNRLAKALYVEDGDIRLQSDPRPGAPPLEKQGRNNESRSGAAESAPSQGTPRPPSGSPPRGRERSGRGRPDNRPPPPPRASQVSHFNDVLVRLGKTQAEIEETLGKPVGSLNRVEMSDLLKSLQDEVRKTSTERHRAYLPEGVDSYESRYLTSLVSSGQPVRFSLFDGSTVEGKITGYGTYIITVEQADGTERTLNKLALVSYARKADAEAQAGDQK